MGEKPYSGSLIERLRKGEKIICFRCGKGIYVTTEGFTSTSHGFWCNECGDTVHCTPGNVIVE